MLAIKKQINIEKNIRVCYNVCIEKDLSVNWRKNEIIQK